MLNSHKSSFLALKFLRVVTQFHGIRKGNALFCPEFQGIKIIKLQISEVFFQKYVSSNSPAGIFSGIAQ